MSNEAIDWVVQTHAPDPNAKLVLFTLASYANTERKAWPSLTTLTLVTQLDRRTVMRKLTELAQAGLITRQRSRNDAKVWSTTTYALNLPDLGAPCPYVGAPKTEGRGTLPPEP